MSWMRNVICFAIMALMILGVGYFQSWNVAWGIVNLCLISAIMALGVNIQWGYAGLLNVGVMGFAALGGLAALLVSVEPVPEAWAAGGWGTVLSLLIGAVTIVAAMFIHKKLPKGFFRGLLMLIVCVGGFMLMRSIFDPATEAIEKVNSASTGYLGGLGLPIILAWPVGGLLAGAAAWVIGKITLGLRSDYLAIATLGISEIIVAILKHEEWMTRGVKNVSGLPRPVPYEVDLQEAPWFLEMTTKYGLDASTFSSIFVKICYAGLFAVVLLLLIWLSEKALKSPWGRMMRAIRDNEVSANAMGKNVKARHLEVFILGSVVVGIAGAMLTTLDGQMTPTAYQPLRFTFVIWVMVIVGGSGNNWGAVLGGFLVWFIWVEAEPLGQWFMTVITSGLAEDSGLKAHLLDSAAHMRLVTMGVILLLVLRFSPKGILPER